MGARLLAHHVGDLIVVDPVPGDVAQQQRFPPSAEALRWRVPPAEPLAPRDAPSLKLEKPSEIRLHLQRQAPANLRHHVLRAVTRLAVLVVADLATFALLRGLIRAARDGAVFGEGLAQEIQTVLPAGYLNGWQFAGALLLGLLVTGSYGQGDRRRDPPRLFAACTLAAPAPGGGGQIPGLSVLLAAWGAQAGVVCGYLNRVQFQEVVDTARAGGCQVLSVPRTAEIAGVHPTTVWRRGQPLVELTAPSLKGWQLAVKRVLDLICGAVGLVVLSPAFALLAVLVKLDSRGPVFFRQERVGLGGRSFRMLKFRTMVNGADGAKASVSHLNHSGDPRLFKIHNDPRVTAIGRWFRRWSLDELPQLWNVLAGDMSLVGPRPFFLADLPLYQAHHFSRLGAKPGVTGLWQGSGRSDIVDFEEGVRLDTQYVREWSLLLDLRILLRTLPAVVRRRGAT